MAETSTIFGFMKYVSATDILSDFKKTVDSHFVNSLKRDLSTDLFNCYSIVALSNALTKSYNAAVSKFLIFLLYRS